MDSKIDLLVEMFNAGTFAEGAMRSLSELAGERGSGSRTFSVESCPGLRPLRGGLAGLGGRPKRAGLVMDAPAGLGTEPCAQEVASELLDASADHGGQSALGVSSLH